MSILGSGHTAVTVAPIDPKVKFEKREDRIEVHMIPGTVRQEPNSMPMNILRLLKVVSLLQHIFSCPQSTVPI